MVEKHLYRGSTDVSGVTVTAFNISPGIFFYSGAVVHSYATGV